MKSRTSVELASEDLIWFREAYPGGSVSWILTILLHNFRSIHDDTGVTPQKVARDAAKEAKESIDEGVYPI